MIYKDKSNASTDKRPTHKIVVAKSPDDEQQIAFYAYSAEEMKSITVAFPLPPSCTALTSGSRYMRPIRPTENTARKGGFFLHLSS